LVVELGLGRDTDVGWFLETADKSFAGFILSVSPVQQVDLYEAMQ
jgi:hypothetical protein